MARNIHAINWFEIPVSDFYRAKDFYETIFGYNMEEQRAGDTLIAFFDYDKDEDGRGGAIVYDPEFYTPSSNGALIFLNCEPDIQKVLDRVVSAGGKIIQRKTEVSLTQDIGYWALILDSEGNRIALHSLEA